MRERHRPESHGQREVVLKVGGAAVELNRFVNEIFQEVVVGLVRTLGHEDENEMIELQISPAPKEQA